MRQPLVGGAVLAVATALLIVLGEALGLDVEHVALLGAALGAVIALVPDRSPMQRLLGFAVGFALAWIGYILRAAVLPDTAGGRAVAALIVLLVAAGIAAATVNNFTLPLWSLLVGMAALVGSYEEIYTETPPMVIPESTSAATTVLLASAIGFLAVALFSPSIPQFRSRGRRGPKPGPGADSAEEARVPLDDMLSTKETGR